MLKGLMWAVVGAALALGLIYGWQQLGHMLFSFPAGMDLTDPGRRPVLAGNLSFPAQAWTIAGYVVGVGVAGLFANIASDSRWPSVFVALVAVGAFFATLTMTAQPFWIQMAGLLLPLLVGVGVAARVGRRTLVE